MTHARPANQRSTRTARSAHEDAPAVLAGQHGVRWRAAEAVDLGGRERQMTAAARGADEAGRTRPPESAAQALVGGEQRLGNPFGGGATGLVGGDQLDVDGRL